MHYAPSDHVIRIYQLEAGQPFGGCDIVNEQRRPFQAVASGTATVMRFDGWSILGAAGADAGFGLMLIHTAVSAGVPLARRLVELSVDTVPDRVRREPARQVLASELPCSQQSGVTGRPPLPE